MLTAVLDTASWIGGEEPNRIGVINGHTLRSHANERYAVWRCSLYFDDEKQDEMVQTESLSSEYAESYLAYNDEYNQTISVASGEAVKHTIDATETRSGVVQPANQLWSLQYFEWLGETAESKLSEMQEYLDNLPPTHVSYAFSEGEDLSLYVVGGVYGSFVGVSPAPPIGNGPSATASPPSALSDMYAIGGGFGRIGFNKLNARNYLSCVHIASTNKHFLSTFNLLSPTEVIPIDQEFTFLNARPWLHGGQHPITGEVQISDKFIAWV